MRAIFLTSLIITSTALLTGCTTTNNGGDGTNNLSNVIIGGYVDPDMAKACINTGANKYFMPTNSIRAINSQKQSNGSTQVIMKVDSRDAVCTINASGNVVSFVDTSPKSADQIAAEAQLSKSTIQNSVAPST